MNRAPILFESEQPELVSDSHTQPVNVSRIPFFPALDRTSYSGVYSCFLPIHYEAGYSYPLIVWLHGPDSNEDEVSQAMPHISVRNHVAIAPRGNRCIQHDEAKYCWGTSSSDAAEAVERVVECVGVAQQEFNIHPERIFLAGYASGGTLALRLALEYPELCAGVVSLGGPMPRGSRPLKRINDARKIPVMLGVSPSEQYPLDQVMDDLRLMHSAGFSIELRVHPEGDELTKQMLAEVNVWIMEQFCPQSVSADC